MENKSLLLGVPGWSLYGKDKIKVHRTHFPLLGVPQFIEYKQKYNLPFDLRSYQPEAKDFIVNRFGTLEADEMRLGKTATIVAAHDMSTGPIVVVGPLQAKSVWCHWFQKRWPSAKIGWATGRNKDRENVGGAVKKLLENDCIFIHYDILPAWQFQKKLGMVVFDEAHILSNYKSLRTQAALFMASQAQKVVCATGTPVWNKPSGMYSILSMLNPGAWGSRWEFGSRYCAGSATMYGWKADGISSTEEFQARMSDVMIRRTWAEVAPDLPGIHRTVDLITLEPEDIIKIDMKINTMDLSNTSIGQQASLRKVFGEFKIDRTIQLAQATLNSGEPIVIWAWHKSVAKKIAKELKGYLINGDNSHQLSEILENWKNDLAPKALVITMAVGQTAIDLSYARHCIFAEIDFTPVVVSQAEMRTFSIDRGMSAIYVVVNHPMDMSLVRSLLKKITLSIGVGISLGNSPVEIIAEAVNYAEDATELDLIDFLLEESDE